MKTMHNGGLFHLTTASHNGIELTNLDVMEGREIYGLRIFSIVRHISMNFRQAVCFRERVNIIDEATQSTIFVSGINTPCGCLIKRVYCTIRPQNAKVEIVGPKLGSPTSYMYRGAEGAKGLGIALRGLGLMISKPFAPSAPL